MKDTVVGEVWRTREQHAAKFNFDLTKIVAEAPAIGSRQDSPFDCGAAATRRICF
jgi:hypothetical protein